MNEMEELTNRLVEGFKTLNELWVQLEAENERLRAYIAELEKKESSANTVERFMLRSENKRLNQRIAELEHKIEEMNEQWTLK